MGHKWCNYWFHVHHLNTDSGKMSKSKGEFLTVSLLEQKGYDPMAYRLFCLQSHYRRNLVFSWENLDNAVAAYDKLVAKIATLKNEGEIDQAAFDQLKQRFVGALNGDLNTSVAVTCLYDVLKAKCNDATKLALIADFDQVLSLNLLENAQKLRSKQEAEAEANADPVIDGLVAARNDENLPVVLLAHTTIGKCDSTGHDLADDYQVGGIDRLPITELGNGYDYVALGHIHKQQNLDNDGRVWYSGTPIAVSFDEIMPGNTHGVLLAECNAHGGSVNVTPLEIKNEKPLVNIPVSGAGKWNDVLETFKAFPDNLPAFIRLNVAVEDYLPSGARDAAESAASHKECTFCKINAQREQAKDADDGSSKGFTVSEMKKVDPTDVAKKWFSQLKTVADYERRVEAVINKAKEEIASGKE